MSLEQKIDNLSAVIEKLIAVIEAGSVAPVVKEEPKPVVKEEPAPAPTVAAPVAPQAAPAPAPTQMPTPPTFEPVAAPEVAQAMAEQKAPFEDGKGLTDYVMKAYREMGPAKGQNIQGVLNVAGYHNINDVKPEHYYEIYRGIEKLRTA